MQISDVERIVQDEISRGEPFDNSHGITLQNLQEFLVEPSCVRVDPDDEQSPPRDMWVVLKEQPSNSDGYAVAYDAEVSGWGVIERTSKGYLLVCAADSLASALTGM